MKKYIKVISSILTLILVFSACNTNNQDKNKTLTVSWWGSESRNEAMNEVIRLYVEEYPDISISEQHGAFEGWQSKLMTQLAGGTEPDVMQINYNWVHSFGRGENVFYDLNQVSDSIDLSQWSDKDLESMVVDGQLAAVPHGLTARAHLYNKSLFEEYGIEYPKTYDEMIEAGAIIGVDNTSTGVDNKYVLTNIGKESTDLFIAQMLYNKTGKVMQENGVVNYTVEEVKEIFDMYKALEDSGALPTFYQEDPLQNESNPVWTSGNSGSVYEWIGTTDKYVESFRGGTAREELGIASYVRNNVEDELGIFVKPSLGFAISKKSSNPELAAHFINFMFTNEDAIRALGTSLGVSSHAKTNEIQRSEGLITDIMEEGFAELAKHEQVTIDPYFEDENVRGKRIIAIEAFRTGKDTTEAAKDYIENQQAELDKLFR